MIIPKRREGKITKNFDEKRQQKPTKHSKFSSKRKKNQFERPIEHPSENGGLIDGFCDDGLLQQDIRWHSLKVFEQRDSI